MNEDSNNAKPKSKKATIIKWAIIIAVLIVVVPPIYRYTVVKIPEYITKAQDRKYAPVFQKIVNDCSQEMQSKYGQKDSGEISEQEYGKMFEDCVNSKNTNDHFDFKYSE